MGARSREIANGRSHGIGFSALSNSIGFLTNPSVRRRDDVPPLRPSTIAKLPVQELVLTTQVLLREHFGVRLELFGTDWLACRTVENLR